MIPKIIHYCWFGKGLMPKSQKDCIKSWKKIMPDYKIIRWDESNFDVNFCEYTKEAYKIKKYAYVSDVARLKALSDFGGVYLDTDVEVFEKMDKYLNANFFSAIELYKDFYSEDISNMLNEDGTPKEFGVDIPHLEIMTSTMGCVPNSLLINEILEYYIGLKPDEDFIKNFRKYVNYDRLVARYATKYGFRYRDELQHLDNNIIIYPTGIFGHVLCPNQNFKTAYHYGAGSWHSVRTMRHRIHNLLDKLHLLQIYKAFKSKGK